MHREDEKIRFRDHPGAAAQDHLLADLERAGERERQLQRRLHQRARADPLAHADRPPAVLPGPHLDARVRRRRCAAYRPPVDTRRPSRRCTASSRTATRSRALNFITPHQKWGIHSTYSDNLLMLTLTRGGPMVWLSEDRRAARPASWTTTGSSCSTSTARSTARAVVSQRVTAGHVHDVPRAGEDRERAGLARSPASAAASTTR